MMLDYINEAFKSLDRLTEDVFRADSEGIEELSDFVNSSEDEEGKISIIDMDAETEEDLQDSYIGKAIVDCNICRKHMFKDKEDIKIEDGVVDIGEECPYCGENNGFVVIGEIHEFKPETDEEEIETPEDATETPVEEVEETEELIEESLAEQDEDIVWREIDDLFAVMNGDLQVFVGTKEECEKFVNAQKQNAAARFQKFRIVPCATVPVSKEESLVEESNMRKLRTRYPELSESFKNVSLETDNEIMTMTSEDNGKVTVTTEPVSNRELEGEMIAPLSDESQDEIININADSVEEETPVEEVNDEEPVDETTDVEIDEVDEESMSDLGESYLKRVYENVDSFKLTSCSTTPTQLVLEGLITFKSGATRNTGFIFEAKDATKDGKVRFIGENAHLARGRKAFTLVGSMNNSKKLVCESLTYNYRAKTNEGKSTRVYGKVNRNK